jgi:hypothetical protein
MASHNEVAHHNRKRLGITVLSLAQPFHSRLAARVADEVIAAEALNGPDHSASYGGCCVLDWIPSVYLCSISVQKSQARAARGTSNRLRMEPSVSRILILLATGRTHGKPCHRRSRAVVRCPSDNSESRATVRAVQECIAKAGIARIDQLSQTSITCGDIRGDE